VVVTDVVKDLECLGKGFARLGLEVQVSSF
jgi:hypothetical protein